jgi:hypothetical protein
MGDVRFKRGDYVEYRAGIYLMRGFIVEAGTQPNGDAMHYVHFVEKYNPDSDRYSNIDLYEWIFDRNLCPVSVDLQPKDYEAMYAFLIDHMLLQKDIEACKALRQELDQRLSQIPSDKKGEKTC